MSILARTARRYWGVILGATGDTNIVLNWIRRALLRQSEPFPDLPAITLTPIGVVRSKVKTTQVPGFDWAKVTARIVIRPELEDALLGLDTYSHIKVLFWPHLVPEDVRGSKHRLHPRDDSANPLQGILATRSQIRFNPVLVTSVQLLGMKGNEIRVRGLDAVDGSPVLDVKPYIPSFDSVPDASLPDWVQR